jgi:hypothetical protein
VALILGQPFGYNRILLFLSELEMHNYLQVNLLARISDSKIRREAALARSQKSQRANLANLANLAN